MTMNFDLNSKYNDLCKDLCNTISSDILWDANFGVEWLKMWHLFIMQCSYLCCSAYLIFFFYVANVGRCNNMFVLAAAFSFPEGGLSHLLSTDYLLS